MSATRSYKYGRFTFLAEVTVDGGDLRTLGYIHLNDSAHNGSSLEFAEDYGHVEDCSGREITIPERTLVRARNWIESQWELLLPIVERNELKALAGALVDSINAENAGQRESRQFSDLQFFLKQLDD